MYGVHRKTLERLIPLLAGKRSNHWRSFSALHSCVSWNAAHLQQRLHLLQQLLAHLLHPAAVPACQSRLNGRSLLAATLCAAALCHQMLQVHCEL